MFPALRFQVLAASGASSEVLASFVRSPGRPRPMLLDLASGDLGCDLRGRDWALRRRTCVTSAPINEVVRPWPSQQGDRGPGSVSRVKGQLPFLPFAIPELCSFYTWPRRKSSNLHQQVRVYYLPWHLALGGLWHVGIPRSASESI